MSLHAHLIHSCTVQRATPAEDPYRNKVETWADYATGVACRLVAKQQRIVSDDRAQFLTVTAYTLLVPADTAVIPEDRITNVVENGTVIDAGPFTVKAVLPRRTRAEHHKSLALERVA